MSVLLRTRGGSISSATSLSRTIAVRIDGSTWPSGSTPPASFINTTAYALDVFGLLLLIGELTTPATGRGATLSEYYAWVRYLHAVGTGPRLQISRPFCDLDGHQKTILSDDFGMGVGMYWAREKLGLRDIMDGRYFIQHLQARLRAIVKTSAKKGPTKSPDFVAEDAGGRWHVVECKGTQTGKSYRKSQLKTGAVQKRVVQFPLVSAGERLVCGLTLEADGSARRSELLVVDPYRGKIYDVGDNELQYATDASVRSVVAKGLRRAGFPITANAVGRPFGDPEKIGHESLQLGTPLSDNVRQAALGEIASGLSRNPFWLQGEDFVGISNDFPVLPSASIKSGMPGPIRLRYGVTLKLLAALQMDGLSAGVWLKAPGAPKRPLADHPEIVQADHLGRMEIKNGTFSSELTLGSPDDGSPTKTVKPTPPITKAHKRERLS